MREIISEVRSFITAGVPDPDRFEVLARRVFSFQFERNEPYRGFCQRRGITPATVGAASEIPAIPTSAFKELELTVLPPGERSRVFYSSGTTEQRRSRHFHSDATLGLYEESLLGWFEPNVLPDALPEGEGGKCDFLILAPEGAQARHSSLVHMFEVVAKRFGRSVVFAATIGSDGGWELDFPTIERAAARYEGRPVVICGTAFSFVHLCDHLSELGRTLCFPPGSRVFETGGYKGRSRAVSKVELHAMISERLSLTEMEIITEYGMSEISAQAYDRRAGESGPRIFRFPPWARATVISPESGGEVGEGETGLLRIVDLSNVGSVLSIQTEDLAVRRGGRFEGFEGFELIGRAQESEPRGCSLMQVNS